MIPVSLCPESLSVKCRLAWSVLRGLHTDPPSLFQSLWAVAHISLSCNAGPSLTTCHSLSLSVGPYSVSSSLRQFCFRSVSASLALSPSISVQILLSASTREPPPRYRRLSISASVCQSLPEYRCQSVQSDSARISLPVDFSQALTVSVSLCRSLSISVSLRQSPSVSVHVALC